MLWEVQMLSFLMMQMLSSTYLSYDRTYRAAYGTIMNLIINAIIKHKIVIGKSELEK